MITPEEYVRGMEALGFRFYALEQGDDRFAFTEMNPDDGRDRSFDEELELSLRRRLRSIPNHNQAIKTFLLQSGRTIPAEGLPTRRPA